MGSSGLENNARLDVRIRHPDSNCEDFNEGPNPSFFDASRICLGSVLRRGIMLVTFGTGFVKAHVSGG